MGADAAVPGFGVSFAVPRNVVGVIEDGGCVVVGVLTPSRAALQQLPLANRKDAVPHAAASARASSISSCASTAPSSSGPNGKSESSGASASLATSNQRDRSAMRYSPSAPVESLH